MDILNKFILEIESLTYQIKKKKLLNDISFKVESGDMISVVGPNGSGKSTLIRLIAGEIIPSSGWIKFHNKNIYDWNPLNLAIKRAVLYQSSHLSFSFTVLDIIKMGFYALKESDGEKDYNKICEQLLDVFDLNGYSDRIYTTLSGGEKQRVQLARVIAQIWSEQLFKDRLLILDEPTSYLDIKHQLSLFKFLRKLNNKGLTIIMVLHDLNQAFLKSNKVAMLKESKLVNFGKTSELMNEKTLKKVFDVNLNLLHDVNLNTKFIAFDEEKNNDR